MVISPASAGGLSWTRSLIWWMSLFKVSATWASGNSTISVTSRCSLVTTVFALDQSDISCRSNRSLKWPCNQATCSIFVSARWRIPVKWCAVENLYFRCRVGAISVASIFRCISVFTGMPQKVRIVRSGSFLVFYPHITIIKNGLCSWTFFKSGIGQGAPASVVSISRAGVILSFLIVTPVSISATLVSTLMMPGLAPVLWATVMSAVAFLMIRVFRFVSPVIKMCFLPPLAVLLVARAARSCSSLWLRPGHHGPSVHPLVQVQISMKAFLMQSGNDVIFHPFLWSLTDVSRATYT